MQRTAVAGARPAASKPVESDWVSPRIDLSQVSKFRGRNVIIIAQVLKIMDDQQVALKDLVSGSDFVMQHLPPGVVLGMCNEFTLNIEQSGKLSYVAHAVINDEGVDVEVYKKLLELIHNHHSALFY